MLLVGSHAVHLRTSSSRFLLSSLSVRCLYHRIQRKLYTMADSSRAVKMAENFLSFVEASPTPFHAVHSAKLRLEKAGFSLIKERESWSSTLKPGGKYYLTRNSSTIVAFAIGKKWRPGNPIAMIGAHTDSPCLRIKPVSKKQGDGFLQVGVETYGGGLWHTWFDRDLSIAGRAMVREKDGTIGQKLVRVARPILRIPTLAPHLDRQETFAFNKESQLFPIAGLAAAELNRQGKGSSSSKDVEEGDEKANTSHSPLKPLSERHHPYVVETIANELGVSAEDIVDFEMVLYDTQKPCIGGLNNELIFSARLDNLGMTYCSIEALMASVSGADALDDDPTLRLVACFDNEEIGSTTTQGANSSMLPAIVRRLCATHLGSSEPAATAVSDDSSSGGFEHLALDAGATAYEQTLATSFLISADMAHSVHPNYPAKHEADHRPEMNKGTVIKINANARYTSNSPGITLLHEAARLATRSSSLPVATDDDAAAAAAGVPLQLFVVRNDSPCGSTIGPMLAAKLGSRAIDVGNAQLAMHSIRECAGVFDVEHGVNLFESFFVHFKTLEQQIAVD